MKNIILQKLKDIEQREHVKIIYAVESGSRAWGFESPDSDYDVRFIYVRRLSDYLSLFPQRETINDQCDKTFDINGWDLSKALKLLYKSNPTLYEWKLSPIVYIDTKEWHSLEPAFQMYFQTQKALHHYYHMSVEAYKTLSLKKCLYTLRTLLACLWIIQKQTPPPIELDILVNTMLPQHLKSYVENLLNLKKVSDENKEYLNIPQLDQYIQEQFSYIQSYLYNQQNNLSFDLLNNLFLSILQQNEIESNNSCSHSIISH